MQGVTLLVAALGSTAVLLLRPAQALGAYLAVLVWYPDFLRISFDTIDISVGRIVITVLLIRCLSDSRILGNFKWSRMDSWVMASMVVYVGVYCVTHPFEIALENRGGFVMDTWFVYMATRLVISDRRQLFVFVKVIGIVLASLALLGVFEAVTHDHPYAGLKRYRPWRSSPEPKLSEVVRLRFGFSRAMGPFPHSIIFGNCFAMFMPLVWALRHQPYPWKKLSYVFFGMLLVGALSSMSSCPWVMMAAVIFCLLMEKHKHLVKPFILTFFIGCVGVEVLSNRRFYHVFFDAANLAGGDWWQRAKLVDVAIDHVSEWWLAGYGGADPGWGDMHFWQDFTDINNEFILAGVNYGLLGIVALCAVLLASFRYLVQASRRADLELRSLYWALGSMLTGVIVVWQGVSFFGQMVPLFNVTLGLIGSSVGFAQYASLGNIREYEVAPGRRLSMVSSS